MHADEKSKLDDKRKALEDEMNSFSKKKAAAELLQGQSFSSNSNLKKDKDRKKSVACSRNDVCNSHSASCSVLSANGVPNDVN